LSFADYVWLRDKPWKEWDPKAPPSFFQTAMRTHEDKGDVYLEPQECEALSLAFSFLTFECSSFILKVKAAEIVSSGVFSGYVHEDGLIHIDNRPISYGLYDAFPSGHGHP
jgi:DNA ligase-4